MLHIFDGLRTLTFQSLIIRLILAMLFGGFIGLERGRKQQPAGFRTYMLVCLGAALTILLPLYSAEMIQRHWQAIAQLTLKNDVSRFGAQAVGGIGFLGAGTILITGRQQVKGLTTAAGLWASACMGLAIGAGFYEAVILAFILIFFAVKILPPLETMIVEKARFINIYVEVAEIGNMGEVINTIKAQHADILDLDIERKPKDKNFNPNAVLALRLPQHQQHTKILTRPVSYTHLTLPTTPYV